MDLRFSEKQIYTRLDFSIFLFRLYLKNYQYFHGNQYIYLRIWKTLQMESNEFRQVPSLIVKYVTNSME
jgi:hypothetical protein